MYSEPISCYNKPNIIYNFTVDFVFHKNNMGTLQAEVGLTIKKIKD